MTRNSLLIIVQKIIQKYQQLLMIGYYLVQVFYLIMLILVDGLLTALRLQNHVKNLPVLPDEIWFMDVVNTKRKTSQVIMYTVHFLYQQILLTLNSHLLTLITLWWRLRQSWNSFSDTAKFEHRQNDITASSSHQILGVVEESYRLK